MTGRGRPVLQRLLLAGASLALVLGVLEIGLRLAPPEPDGFGHTRAAQRWQARHWRPINAAGYRDVQHSAAELREDRRLVVLGDSFAAGSGVPDISDRFAGVLAEALGERWTVVVLARPGWSSGHQAEALEGFPYPPHVVVLSYYLNDIEVAAAAHGHAFEIDLSVQPVWLAPLVASSDLASFVYWRLRRAQLWRTGRGYGDFVYDAFADEAVWQAHRRELERIVAHARRQGAIPVVVVFPHLFDLEGSREPVVRLTRFFEDAGVTVVDVAALIAAGDWTREELIAGPVDPHPSEPLHQAVGEALLPFVRP